MKFKIRVEEWKDALYLEGIVGVFDHLYLKTVVYSFVEKGFDNFHEFPKLNEHLTTTIYRCTDQVDARGWEIYEGDIVRMWNGNKATISYDKGYFRIGKRKRIITEHEWGTFEIIGNIYNDKYKFE